MNAKTGEANLRELRAVELVFAVVERRRVKCNFLHFVSDHFVYANRLVKKAAQVKKLNLERKFLVTPQRARRIKANVARLVIAQVLQLLRQRRRLPDMGPARQLTCAAVDVGKAEGLRGRCRRACRNTF